MSVDDFLKDLPSDSDDIFAEIGEDELEEEEKESDNSTEDQEDQEEEKPASEGDESDDESKDESNDTDAKEKIKLPPLHENPRFKKVYKESKDKDRRIEELEKQLASDKPATETKSQPVPDYAKQLGYEQDTWDAFNEQEVERTNALKSSLKDELKQEIIADREAEAKQKEDRQKEIDTYYEEEKVRVKDQFSLSDSDINSVVKFAIKEQPTDANGVIDVEKAFYMWDRTKGSKKTTRKKKVAEMMNSDSSTSANEDVVSSQNLRNSRMTDLI